MNEIPLISAIFIAICLVGIASLFLYANLNLAFILPNLFYIQNNFSIEVFVASLVFQFLFLILINNAFKNDFVGWLFFGTIIILALGNIVVMVIDGFSFFLINLNNLFLLYGQFYIAIYAQGVSDFEGKYHMTADQAKSKIRGEKIMEFGARFALGSIFNVFGFLFKPLTDEFGHKFFNSTDMRNDIEELKDLKKAVIAKNTYPLMSTAALFVFYGIHNYESISIKMSYVNIIHKIIGLF